MLESSLNHGNTGVGLEAPKLATQLQQAWLQTQLSKRNLEIEIFSNLSSPDSQFGGSQDHFERQRRHLQQYVPPLSGSSSVSTPSFSTSPRHFPDAFFESYSVAEGGSAVNIGGQDELGRGEPDLMEDDIMLQYLSDMLMEEEMVDQKCMYVQCSSYQAAMKEPGDFIGGENFTDSNLYGEPTFGSISRNDEAEKETALNSWIDEVLNSNPDDFFNEEMAGECHSDGADLADEVSSIATGITNITTGSPKSWCTGSPTGYTFQEATPSPTPAPSPAAAAPAVKKHTATVKKHRDVYDCPYLENDPPENVMVDYTNNESSIASLEDLYPLLMQFAQAVATDNVPEAHKLIDHLRVKTSPFGDGGERVAYYVVEALVARLSGSGSQLYTAVSSSRPSAADMLRSYRTCVQFNPVFKIAHFFANASILRVVQGSDRIHIIDYGISYGVQWPSLLKKLHDREGGPPHVRITGIDFTQPGFQRDNRVQETGRRLQAKAKEIGVELEYHALAGKWENITPAQLQLRDDESLIVNCIFALRNLLDETVMASSPRKVFLSRIHSLNPKIFVMGVLSAGYNSPFFINRVRETINHYAAVFDGVHTTLPLDPDLRLVVEKEILGREILNIIACDGAQRIERAETYRHWQSRSINAGFKQLPLDPTILPVAQEFLKNFHRNYGIAMDGNWLLNGWRDRVLYGLTAWTCN